MRVQKFDAVAVEFIEKRWDVTIRVTLPDGSVREWVTSADAAFTEGSGIWLGTKAEYDEAWERL